MPWQGRGWSRTYAGDPRFRWDYRVRFRVWNAGLVEVDQRGSEVSAARSIFRSIAIDVVVWFRLGSFELVDIASKCGVVLLPVAIPAIDRPRDFLSIDAV
jgi:hypothetical protein